MTHLILSVLGEFQVLIDDVPISTFESDKVRALLAYLAVEAGSPHRRETLVGLLWPDSPEDVARHNLSQALFNLRLALGDHTAKLPYLLITRDAIQFNRQSNYSLDLDQFNACFDAWEKSQERERGGASTIPTELEQMVKLYRGEFLKHFSIGDSLGFEDWILVQRESLRQRVLDALTYLANEYELRGDFQIARHYALRQLEMDPWREEAHYQIMRVLALDGQRSAALAQYETCKRVLAEELGVEPSTKTDELYEQIRLGTLKTKDKPPSQVPAAIHNLPASLTPFFGREPELANLAQLLADPECRCITLVGPGGIGKTRLALQAADQHRNEFAQGAAFIPLASVESTEAVMSAIANGIHFAFYGPSDPKLQLINYLREKNMLLILDNVEHLLAEEPSGGMVVELLIEILQQTTQVKLLVTSREALNLQGELSFEIQGLAFPRLEQSEAADEFSAVSLFAQRARRARPEFLLNEENKNGAVRICHLVEGMPLAIELAATWVRLLSPSEIAAEIERSLDFLHAQMRDLPERHRSIRAVFDHSWQMLSMEEKKVLGRLSAFRGGFERQAAEQVTGASLSVLSSLIIRSLLRRTATGRYDLHELVRQYSASKLAENPNEMNSVQELHSLYYLGLLEAKDTKLRSLQQKEILAELTAEIDNIRAAWDWSVTHQEIVALSRTSATLWYLFELHNWYKEGEVTFWKCAEALQADIREEGPDQTGLHTTLNAILAHYTYFRFRQGKSQEAYATLVPCAAFLRTSTDPLAAIYTLLYLGIVCWELGKFAEATEVLRESLLLTRRYEVRWYEAWVSEFLGIVAHEQGEYNKARQYLSDALAVARKLEDRLVIAHVLSYLSRTTMMLGEYTVAEELLRESLRLAREIGYHSGTGLALDALGQVTHAQGKNEEAHAFYLESVSLFVEIGDAYRLSRVMIHQGLNFLALHLTAEAQNTFRVALRKAQKGGFIPTMLDALTGLAALDTQQKASQETLELVNYILQHQAGTQEAKNLAAQLQAELESKLSLKKIKAAEQHARTRSLDEFVRQALANV
jgi:DNA-binding SARP family transcriptional activator/predicted ATPase